MDTSSPFKDKYLVFTRARSALKENSVYIDFLHREIGDIISLNSKISVEHSLDSIFGEVMSNLADKVSFERCNLLLADEHGFLKNFQTFSSDGEKGSFFENSYPQRVNFRNSDLFICRVLLLKEEFYLADSYSEYLSVSEKSLYSDNSVRSLYYLPIALDGEILGALRFHNFREGLTLSESDRDLIRRRVVILASAIKNKNLLKKLKQKNDAMDLDLSLAKRIQDNFLPRKNPSVKKLSIASRYIPMYEVGGDFYDFHVGDDDELGAIMTDASGHGVSAAFITSMVKMAFHSERVARKFDSPDKLMKRLNEGIVGRLADNFVTAFYCYFNMSKMELKVSCAGHNPLYIFNRKRCTLSSYHPNGKILGLMEDVEYEEEEIKLSDGDRVILYTDGIPEARNKYNEEFSSKFINLIERERELDADSFCNTVIEELRKFTGRDNGFDDDIAIIVFDVNSASKGGGKLRSFLSLAM